MCKSKASLSFVHPLIFTFVVVEAVQSVSQQSWDQIIRVDLCYHLEVLAAAVVESHERHQDSVREETLGNPIFHHRSSRHAAGAFNSLFFILFVKAVLVRKLQTDKVSKRQTPNLCR